MAEETTQPERQFVLQKIYVKDVSFETPNSPEVFTLKWEPKVEFNLSSNAQKLQENLYEVSLTTTVTVKLGEKTAYLVEVCQAGIFAMAGFDDQELGPLIGSYCPNVLFPYAREAVSDLVTKGGFPPMLLAPINFDALYMQQMQQQQGSAPTSH
ncbi:MULTISPECIES: protein-export chaperone SecB [Methylocaldum]|jgi:preprotein translocase subunit SecB|uniref:protein-export chaperone SecB n=1 Tax=unclassified Methylocaldum TaxID=2622260 RepID=UPI00098AF4B8|nr:MULTISPECIES: protein-export chaperone SecB [unclassified Methylocaldum]MBP1148466.1 preprotein translocase subunit SecB [Methylocaldum sp. RMAD-M]MDV3241054.1 protein-export chaperone SecB [Methylocaldum sp.]MVF22025.1 protein-export chaperone SecB [Methylocaldum sp. BRCS4]